MGVLFPSEEEVVTEGHFHLLNWPERGAGEDRMWREDRVIFYRGFQSVHVP